MREPDVQRSQSTQVGFVMRAYRESFSTDDGRRGLTQEALLERMAAVDSDYAERYSHATVSRWESGSTRPTLQRLRVFGRALNLSRTEVAGLILMAGLAPDVQAASRCAAEGAGGDTRPRAAPGEVPHITVEAGMGAPSALKTAVRFWGFRVLPLGLVMVAGYLLSVIGWENSWMPTAYIAFVLLTVLAQGFLFPNRRAAFREFFWVSLFFLLSTPLLQFVLVNMDHYNFYRIGSLAGTQVPYVLALLLNLLVAAAAGQIFHLQWLRQYSGDGGGSSVLRRAAWVALPPVVFAYAVVFVITNISVTIQLALLLSVLGVVFTALLILRDPAFSPSERDRLFLLSAASLVGVVAMTLSIVAVMAIYLSPDLPSVLPDHNLLRSWEIDFAQLGLSREQALDRLNLGFMWHAIWVFAYMSFVVGGNLMVAIYRIDTGQRR